LKFIAVLLVMSLRWEGGGGPYTPCWSTHAFIGDTVIKGIMPLDRFTAILRALCASKMDDASGAPAYLLSNGSHDPGSWGPSGACKT
jgi:hypothetical protein